MKKGLVITSMVAASALMLAGCAKSISFEEAKKHCDEKFTSTAVKVVDVHEVRKVSKAEGFFATFFDVGETVTDDQDELCVVTSEDVEDYFGEKASYKVDGTKLIADYKYSTKEIKEMFGMPDTVDLKGSAEEHAETDEAGYLAVEWAKMDISFTYSESGVSLSGALTFEDVITYTAAK